MRKDSVQHAPHALPPVSHASGALRARCGKRANCWLLCTAWFTEGFDTLDLKEAKALLDALVPEVEKRCS